MNAFRKIVGLAAIAAMLGLGSGCGQIIGLKDLPPAAGTSDDTNGSTENSDSGTDASATPDGDLGTGGPCVDGGSCTPGECQSGEYSCVDGKRICKSTTHAPDGSPCGTAPGSVCSAGACVSCSAGADCSDPSAPCVKKTIDCSNGAPVCKSAMNVPDGTGCGNGQYCYAGVCSVCQVGNACSPASNPCHIGKVTSCAAGTMTCTDQNGSAAAGTSCATSGVPSGVCDGKGTCTACTANAACTPQGMPCQQGTMSCTSGAVCASPVDINEGKPCGSGSICSSGSCTACNATSCPNGCCDGTGCVTAAQTSSNCGAKGAVCAACPSGQSCTAGGGGCSCIPPTTACNGECANLQTDPKNCGKCGMDCTSLPNVVAGSAVTCNAGVCNVASSCATGFAHCSSAPMAGCETNVTSKANCGSCGAACLSTMPSCSKSGSTYACGTGCSAPDTTLCNTGACVDTTSDPNNCGVCGKVCPAASCSNGMFIAPSTCSGGTCTSPVPEPCPNGFACNAAGTACQTSCTKGALSASCSQATPYCTGTTCVAQESPGTACTSSAAAECTTGVCGGGYCCGAAATCSFANGAGNCGGPSGQCVLTTCNSGYGNCSNSPTGPCNPLNTTLNCGTCGHACGSGQNCTSGNCSCPNAAETSCPDGCFDLQTSGTHCGSCANPGCPAGQACNGGTCECNASSCPGGCCTIQGTCDTSHSTTSCGTGGAACTTCNRTDGSTSVCSSGGVCTITACGQSEAAYVGKGAGTSHAASYYMDCDGIWSNGCETKPSDPNNCGACSMVCPATYMGFVVACAETGTYTAVQPPAACEGPPAPASPPTTKCGLTYFCGFPNGG